MIIFMSSFKERVLEIVSKIPKGEVRSYAEIARLAGSPRAYRAVGALMKDNFDPRIPCHRVIRSDGFVGEYNRGQDNKKKILENEGVHIVSGKVSLG